MQLRRGLGLAVSLLVAAACIGCGRSKLETVPVSAKVTYKGQPLKFGNVLFQPDVGAPAKAEIQPDGTFTLTTDGQPGALVGRHRVEVRCREDQGKPADPKVERPPGRSLIPEKYTNFETSGITREVKKDGGPYDINLD